jgi:hypothetical protein
MGRWLVLCALAACGRLGFDPTPPAAPLDGATPACTGSAATDPPASGGGFQLVRAWGAAPNAPAGSPTTDTVGLAWESRGAASYTVVRAQCAVAIDPATTTPCTPTTTDACLACTTATTSCRDDQALPSPARVRYQVFAGTATASDDADFTVDVPAPPPNMVLVHRASVNREMCDLLASPTVRTEHHRCAYTGIGAVPLRAHPDSPDLTFPPGFYDFGYDLFVDRWEAGCNWTHAADGGMCGPGGTSGDCESSATGPGAFGVAGNVFYAPYNSRCYVNTGAGWAEVFSLALTNGPMAALGYTNDPGATHDRPPITWLASKGAAAVCGAVTVPGYGAKRVWREREFVAAGAFQRLPGDPEPVTLAEIQTIESGVNHPVNHGCNVQTHDGVTPTGFRSGDELARDLTESTDPAEDPETFVLGSVATSACTSRYGVQDLIGNMLEMTSDQFASCGTGTTCVGEASQYDAGNRDLEGFPLDGVVGNGPNVAAGPLEGAPKVAVTLALQLAATAPYGEAPDPAQLRNDLSELYETGPVFERMGNAGGMFAFGTQAGRFTTDFGGSVDGGGSDASWGFRCVVAAVPR